MRVGGQGVFLRGLWLFMGRPWGHLGGLGPRGGYLGPEGMGWAVRGCVDGALGAYGRF